ncbi:lysoplasmalogenase [Flaviaesturariibacter aridisoli]|uniref:Lysoplasmalogenase n=1 Tax=Flaviaesturariibacter aridisoli TaxID=2545761 RepID=A0A4V2WMW0_9BACT|nr:lysoplasmalogenase [Flaviaesturariibacter aridisoli]TCZ73102.1 lysoplasmalogenase [Flaviaesturariibacter aridisoli]
MKRLYWSLFFIAALLVDGVFIFMHDDGLRVFSKPLLTLLLIGMVLNNTPHFTTRLKVLLLAALAASWVGDVLLLRSSEGYFIAGIAAFLLAQIAYAIAFIQLRQQKGLRFRPLMLVPVATYYVCLITLLYEHLGALRLPVLAYGAVISLMLAMALQLVRLKNRRSAGLLFGGALLFVASDSVLALTRFYWKETSTAHSLLIIGTYGVAQLLLSLGLLNHITPPRAPRKSAEALRQELLN